MRSTPLPKRLRSVKLPETIAFEKTSVGKVDKKMIRQSLLTE